MQLKKIISMGDIRQLEQIIGFTRSWLFLLKVLLIFIRFLRLRP